MRESKWRKRRKRLEKNPPKQIVIKGKIGRCDAQSHGLKLYFKIMEREIERQRRSIRKRRRRGLTDQDPVGVYESEDAMTALYEDKSRRHDDGLLALAEASTPPEEVLALVVPLIEAALRKSKKTHATVRRARNLMHIAADRLLNRTFYVLPHRKQAVEKLAKGYLKGYQKWYRRVEAAEKRISGRMRKNGQSGNALDEALRSVSPELFERS